MQVHGISLVADISKLAGAQPSHAPFDVEPEVHAALNCVTSFTISSGAKPAPCEPVAQAGSCLKGPLCLHHHNDIGGKRLLRVVAIFVCLANLFCRTGWQQPPPSMQVAVLVAQGSSVNHLAGAEIAKFAAACATILRWRASAGPASAGVNSVDSSGAGILHKLAALGFHDSLLAYLGVAGREANLELRNASGMTPLQIAQ